MDVFNLLGSVEVLYVNFPRAWSSEATIYGDAARAGCYDLQALGRICLVMQDVLNLPMFEHLTDLRLAVPVSHDVQRLGNALSQEARDKLKHLWIELRDETGPGGSTDYTFADSDDDEGGEESATFMPGNLQMEFPNRQHPPELWNFVASCRNLEHLGIEATQDLHLDNLDWTPAPNSQGLKTLALKRVYATIPSLKRLLRRGAQFAGHDEEIDPSVICRVAFHYVKIKKDGGHWADLFNYYLHDYYDDLEILRVFNLTYFRAHESFRHNVRIKRSDSIWTENDDDVTALKKLVRKLLSRAGGLDKYPHHCLWEITSMRTEEHAKRFISLGRMNEGN